MPFEIIHIRSTVVQRLGLPPQEAKHCVTADVTRPQNTGEYMLSHNAWVLLLDMQSSITSTKLHKSSQYKE